MGRALPAGLVRPLSWIATILSTRDEGLYHLVVERSEHGCVFARAACGARPWAFGGSFPDGHSAIGSRRCSKCEAVAVRARAEGLCLLSVGTTRCPECGGGLRFAGVPGMLIFSEVAQGVYAYEGLCHECGLVSQVARPARGNE